jgi:adenosine deaminase
MLDAGLLATVNSDDPAYFGGYATDNYVQTAAALGLSDEQLIQLARNSFEASFISDVEKQLYRAQIDALIPGAA